MLEVNRRGIKTCLFLLLCCNVSWCQEVKDTLSKYPRAVLVQLRSEHNRVAALSKARRYEDRDEVIHDAEEVRQRMILDFHNNFTYCPVYYYIDTNVEQIRQKKFYHVLYDDSGRLVNEPVINGNSDDYVIAYYGYPVSQSRQDRIQTETSRYISDPLTPFGRGLVILNDKFLQLTYFYKLGYDEIFFNKKKWTKKYYYSSRHFEIEYFPLAYLFNHNLLQRTGRHHMLVYPQEFK